MQFLPFHPRPAPAPAPPPRLPKHPGFRSDPTTRPIEVVIRMCPDSAMAISGGDRPSWFTKEATFRSVFLHKDDATNITVLYDGTLTEDHWLRKYPVKVVEFRGGNGDLSVLFQIDYIIQQNWSDETVIYSLEDDYVHRPGWPSVLREGLGPIVHPSLSFDYISLYDHLDKYTWGQLYHDLTSKIGITASAHWRTVPSTTNTWASLMWTLRTDVELFRAFRNQDNEKFKTLGRLGRTVGTCIPGWSTHVHSEWLTPCVDWAEYVKTLQPSVINESLHSVPSIPEGSPSGEQSNEPPSD